MKRNGTLTGLITEMGVGGDQRAATAARSSQRAAA